MFCVTWVLDYRGCRLLMWRFTVGFECGLCFWWCVSKLVVWCVFCICVLWFVVFVCGYLLLWMVLFVTMASDSS